MVFLSTNDKESTNFAFNIFQSSYKQTQHTNKKEIKYDMKSGRSNCEIKHLKLTQDIKFVVHKRNFLSFEAKLSYFRTYLISALYSTQLYFISWSNLHFHNTNIMF